MNNSKQKQGKPIGIKKQAKKGNEGSLPSLLCSDSIFGAAHVISKLYDGVNIETLGSMLEQQINTLKQNDTKEIETILMLQAKTLNILFNYMMGKMTECHYRDHVEAYSAIALKVQNRCRQTLATLSDLKHPKRTTFINQQNNAINQQVNNPD